MSLIGKLKLNKRKAIFWILVFVLMVVIFIFSSRDAERSTKDSHKVGKFIGYVTEYDFQDWTEDAQERYATRIDLPVRKTTHFLEYMLLGSFLVYAWYDVEYKKSINVLVPPAIAILYSVTDELHQTFISGRAGMLADVLLDSSGVIVGVIIALLIVRGFRAILE